MWLICRVISLLVESGSWIIATNWCEYYYDYLLEYDGKMHSCSFLYGQLLLTGTTKVFSVLLLNKYFFQNWFYRWLLRNPEHNPESTCSILNIIIEQLLIKFPPCDTDKFLRKFWINIYLEQSQQWTNSLWGTVRWINFYLMCRSYQFIISRDSHCIYFPWSIFIFISITIYNRYILSGF